MRCSLSGWRWLVHQKKYHAQTCYEPTFRLDRDWATNEAGRYTGEQSAPTCAICTTKLTNQRVIQFEKCSKWWTPMKA